MKMRSKKVGDKIYWYKVSPEAEKKGNEARRRWLKANYVRLSIDIPFKMMEDLRKLAETRHMTFRGMMVDIITRELSERGDESV